MNRGRRQQDIFHSQDYYDAFLSTLEETHRRFGMQILCYCLMSNHYHLLVKTPEANLGRAMRHINGVYTRWHNRLLKTDGSPFLPAAAYTLALEAISTWLGLSGSTDGAMGYDP